MPGAPQQKHIGCSMRNARVIAVEGRVESSRVDVIAIGAPSSHRRAGRRIGTARFTLASAIQEPWPGRGHGHGVAGIIAFPDYAAGRDGTKSRHRLISGSFRLARNGRIASAASAEHKMLAPAGMAEPTAAGTRSKRPALDAPRDRAAAFFINIWSMPPPARASHGRLNAFLSAAPTGAGDCRYDGLALRDALSATALVVYR